MDTDKFIHKARLIHGDRYDYSKVVYVNCNTKVCIICPEHGEFWITPSNHLRRQGCRSCGINKKSLLFRDSFESFVAKADKLHQSVYSYPLQPYTNAHTKIKIICKQHGEFLQTPNKHLMGRGCPDCGRLKGADKKKSHHRDKRPDLSHIETPPGSRAVPVGTKGDYALVDEEDYDRVMEHNWTRDANGYATNSTVGFMHRFIMNPPDDMVVDHILHNTLDNRKSQLRVCTQQENCFNSRPRKKSTSKYKGVSWDEEFKRWRASLTILGKVSVIGYFKQEVDAAKAYDTMVKSVRGAFAYLNFPTYWQVVGYGFDKGYEIQEVNFPFVFRAEREACLYAAKLKRVADKLSGFYRSRVWKGHRGELELTNEQYELYERRAEYWGVRNNRLWVEPVEVR